MCFKIKQVNILVDSYANNVVECDTGVDFNAFVVDSTPDVNSVECYDGIEALLRTSWWSLLPTLWILRVLFIHTLQLYQNFKGFDYKPVLQSYVRVGTIFSLQTQIE